MEMGRSIWILRLIFVAVILLRCPEITAGRDKVEGDRYQLQRGRVRGEGLGVQSSKGRGGRVGILGVPPVIDGVDEVVYDEEGGEGFVEMREDDDGINNDDDINDRDGQSLGGVLMPGGMRRETLRSLLRSVLRIHVTRASPDFGFPWRVQAEARGTGSGFPIAARRILTNAHVVADYRVVEVERPGKASRFPARVVGIAHEPDLAIVTVDDDEFWEGLPVLSVVSGPLQLTIPAILSEVLVIGYPTGGDTLSVTKGVVNRAEVGTYAHSNASLLHVQIDAAINPGNSGGPAVTMDGEVIGVAFQGLRSADSIGYIIPAALVHQVLTDFELHGRYTGIAQFAITVQELRNETLKRYLGLPKSSNPDDIDASMYENGCLVIAVDGSPVQSGGKGNAQVMSIPNTRDDIDGTVSADGGDDVDGGDDKRRLKRRDVILKVDGEPVAQDCTVNFREAERLSMSSLLMGLYEGDSREVVVLRDKEIMKINAVLKVPSFVVPTHTEGLTPRYLIFGGLVIVPLTATYILNFKAGKHRVNLSTLARKNQSVFQTPEQEEIVVLSRILSSKISRGYEFQNNVIETINGETVSNLKHAYHLLFESKEDIIEIGFGEHGQFLVIDKNEAIGENANIIAENKILASISPSL